MNPEGGARTAPLAPRLYRLLRHETLTEAKIVHSSFFTISSWQMYEQTQFNLIFIIMKMATWVWKKLRQNSRYLRIWFWYNLVHLTTLTSTCKVPRKAVSELLSLLWSPYVIGQTIIFIYVKKLISLKHCVRSQITRLKLQKSFCDLEHGASLWI